MASLNIAGQTVKVDDAFLKLSPQEQNDVVAQIASSLGIKPGGEKAAGVAQPKRRVSIPQTDVMGNATGGADEVDVPEMQPSRLRDQADDIVKSVGGGLERGTAGLAGTVTDTIP